MLTTTRKQLNLNKSGTAKFPYSIPTTRKKITLK